MQFDLTQNTSFNLTLMDAQHNDLHHRSTVHDEKRKLQFVIVVVFKLYYNHLHRIQ